MVMRQTSDLPQSSQHHIYGERILTPVSGGSLTSAAGQSLCRAGSSPLDMGFTQLLQPPLKYIPGDIETIWPDSILRCFVFLDRLLWRFIWALIQQPGVQGEKVRKGLTTASSLSWERIVCEGTVEGSYEGDLTHPQR